MRWPGAQQAHRSSCVGTIVGNHRLAEQRLRDRGAEDLSHLLEFGARVERAAAGKDDDLLALVQDVSGLREVAFVR